MLGFFQLAADRRASILLSKIVDPSGDCQSCQLQLGRAYWISGCDLVDRSRSADIFLKNEAKLRYHLFDSGLHCD